MAQQYDPFADEVLVFKVLDYTLVEDSKGSLYVARTELDPGGPVSVDYRGPFGKDILEDEAWYSRDYNWSNPFAERPKFRRNQRLTVQKAVLATGQHLTGPEFYAWVETQLQEQEENDR